MSNKSYKNRYAARIALRDGWMCHYCGIPLDPDCRAYRMTSFGGRSVPAEPASPTVDHKYPRYLGGDDSLDNLILSCHSCNSWKSGKAYNLFVAQIAQWMQCYGWKQHLEQLRRGIPVEDD